MLLVCVLTRLFRSRARLEAEILVLRHQLNILQRKSTERAAFKSIDRLVFAGLYRLVPGVLNALKILKPETVIRWHRAGFRAYWRWKSSSRGGRPKIPLEVRQLIRDMSMENPLWGAPRICGELLKLGIDVGQTTVAKYMARGRRPPSQGWKTFLRITRTASRRWICSWSPRSRSGSCMDFWSCGIPAVRFMAGRDRASERPMDCAPTFRGLRLATGAAIYRLRSGLCLWRCLYPSRSRNGHSGPADRTTIAMAG